MFTICGKLVVTIFVVAVMHSANCKDEKILDWILGLVTTTTRTTTTVAGPKVCETCSCGIIQKDKRIINGIETKLLEYPWMAHVTYKGAHLCGASLISDKFVLTAAHAVGISRVDFLRVIFLDHDRVLKNETQTIVRRVVNIIRHDGFEYNKGFNNDIALLELDDEVDVSSDLLRPICLPERNYNAEGQLGTVIGWGSNEEFGSYSNTLRGVAVPIWNHQQCSISKYGTQVTENMMCAGYPEGGKDACKGDSGGPLFVHQQHIGILVGIVSWGYGCAEENAPGVYTKVANYIDWIGNKSKNACYCY